MGIEKNVAVLITIPEECRDKLRTLAAEATLDNPKKVITGAGLAGKIVCWFLKKGSITILDIDPTFNNNHSSSNDLEEQNEATSQEREVK